MNQMKRLKNNCSNECEDCKRLKLDDNRTLLEDLSNEIIYEIFEYLDSHHAYESFYNLNKRFQSLFIHSNLPIVINISSISKQTFGNYIKDIIESHSNRIQTIRLSNFWTMGIGTILFPMMKNFTQLKTLIISDIESAHIDELIDSLSCLPCLTALNITSVDKKNQTTKVYQKIFRLRALKYFQAKFEVGCYIVDVLPVPTNEFSSIEYLIIDNEIKLDILDSLLSYVPKLRHLSLNDLIESRQHQIQRKSTTFNYLSSASFRMNRTNFNDLELLITNFLSQISHLSISYKCSSLNGQHYLDANRWERLISIHLPNLRIFDFQHEVLSLSARTDRQIFKNHISKFDSIFWTTHQWFFEHYYYSREWSEATFFFTTNSYRKSKYIVSDGLPDRIHSKMCSVKQLCIHNENAMRTFPGYFPNVTKLSLSDEFNPRRKSRIIDLNRMLSLRYLNELILDCHRFPLEQIIELLSFTPNVHTLKLDAILLYGTKSSLIQQTDLFRLVSSANTVSHLTINQRLTLDKIQLVIALFPRLECLTIYIGDNDLKPIVRFLLSKSDSTKYRLSSLCFTRRNSAFHRDLEHFISLEKLLNDYTLKFSNEKLCLWW